MDKNIKNSFFYKVISIQGNTNYFKILKNNFCLKKKSSEYKKCGINDIFLKNISFEKSRRNLLNNYNSFHNYLSVMNRNNDSLYINIKRKYSTYDSTKKDVEEKRFDEKYMEEEVERIKEKIKKERLKYKKVIFSIFTIILGVYAYFESYNPEFFLYDLFLKFCLKYVDSELCHDLFLLLGKYNLLPYDTTNDSIYACSEIKNLKFINPFGVAAGFDKNGVSIDSILKLGFSFIEIGTITPREQKGNEKPRIFRDNESRSVINSCGFNNIGCDKVTENLINFRKKQENDKLLSKHIVGVSIGKNKDTVHIIDDLKYCIKKIARYSDYIAINVSSPNTPGLRDNQESEKLRNIILNVKNEINMLEEERRNHSNNDSNYWINTTKEKPLVFVKLAPDLEQEEKKKIADALLKAEVDGMIISNTTTRNFDIKSFENKKGGLSGEKLKDISTKFISEMYNYTNKKIPIIASGGIFNGKDALEKIEAGASVCQLYSCLIFNGMKSAVKIKREFNNLLYQKGYYNLKEAIGKANKNKKLNN